MDFTGFVTSIWSQLGTWASGVLAMIMAALPSSPFTILQQNADVSRVMCYVNYFIPIDFFISVLQPWILAVALYYVWQILLRWIKAIE